MNEDDLRRILKRAYGGQTLDGEARGRLLDGLRRTEERPRWWQGRARSMFLGTGVFAVIAVLLGLVIGLGHRPSSPTGSVATHPSATVSSTATPSAPYSWISTPYPGKSSAPPYVPPATAQVVSTVTAAAPLIVTYDNSQQMTQTSPVRYIARNYQGQVVGSITIDQAAQAAGVLISPDGSKLLIGDLVYDIYGHRLANLYSPTYADALTQPIWVDDSDHLCGTASGNSTGEVRGALLEFSASGGVRTIAQLGPLTGGNWSVLACSPTTDRAVVWQANGSQNEIFVLRLSSGQITARYPAPSSANGAVANHDGSVVAINGSTGITILDTLTGRRLASVVRWGDTNGYSSIGNALGLSWDGSRVLIESDIAQGGPRWLVAWSTNSNLTSQSVDLVDVVPLTSGSTMFIQDPTPPYTAYLLESNGTLRVIT